ncbi:MAG: GNAT family N-acetyltransferase [Candidatus Bathyarchaeota archaeon]|nr:GNAT family N-acetyltransferase [Candidatus Bathyarchaeota archaeon]
MLGTYGSCAKIAYYKDRPVAQILYYPEEAIKTRAFKRKEVLVISCTYNPVADAQKLGIGTRLLKSVIQDARQKKTCLGNRPCKFIIAKAFNTGEALPLPEFYRKNGFIPTPRNDALYLPVASSYEEETPIREYEPLPEDLGKAVVFYGPICQFSFPFANRIVDLVKQVAPNITIELVNEWENPQESIRRKNWWLIVNAKPIRTFFMATERFKQEVKEAVDGKT